MVNTKNEHVFPREGGWIVKREGNRKISRFFEDKKDAMEYAGIMALNESGSVVTHKYNGQFKDFKHGNKISPVITRTIEIIHPIVNNTQPIVETITSV